MFLKSDFVSSLNDPDHPHLISLRDTSRGKLHIYNNVCHVNAKGQPNNYRWGDGSGDYIFSTTNGEIAGAGAVVQVASNTVIGINDVTSLDGVFGSQAATTIPLSPFVPAR